MARTDQDDLQVPLAWLEFRKPAFCPLAQLRSHPGPYRIHVTHDFPPSHLLKTLSPFKSLEISSDWVLKKLWKYYCAMNSSCDHYDPPRNTKSEQKTFREFLIFANRKSWWWGEGDNGEWGSSSHQVAKVLEFQLQQQSFQWTPRTDLLIFWLLNKDKNKQIGPNQTYKLLHT